MVIVFHVEGERDGEYPSSKEDNEEVEASEEEEDDTAAEAEEQEEEPGKDGNGRTLEEDGRSSSFGVEGVGVGVGRATLSGLPEELFSCGAASIFFGIVASPLTWGKPVLVVVVFFFFPSSSVSSFDRLGGGPPPPPPPPSFARGMAPVAFPLAVSSVQRPSPLSSGKLFLSSMPAAVKGMV